MSAKPRIKKMPKLTRTLRDDLHAQMERNLNQWLHDSGELFKIAGLTDRDLVVCLMSSIARVVSRIVIAADLDDDTVLDGMTQTLKIMRRLEKKQARNGAAR
jgi:hypothetical protein